MRCRRCGEENLPGLAACLGCGASLSGEAPAAPVTFVPRVTTRNPLERPAGTRSPGRPPPPLIDQLSTPRVQVGARGVFGALLGLIPGLGPLIRGLWWQVGAQLGAAAALVALGALIWRTPLVFLILVGIQGLMLLGSALESWRWMPALPSTARTVAAAIFAVAALTLAQTGAQYAVSGRYAEVLLLWGTPALPPGDYFVDKQPEAPYQVGDLVAISQGAAVELVPIIAGPGQEVISGAAGVEVDGAPVDLKHLTREGQPLRRSEQVVMEEHWLVLDRDLSQLPSSELRGRVVFCWSPVTSRGPVKNPIAVFVQGTAR